MSLPGPGRVQIAVEVVATRQKIEKIRISKDSPVYVLKMRLGKPTGVLAPEQLLVHKGIAMEDGRTIGSYGVETEDIILLVRHGPPVVATTLSNSRFIPASFLRETKDEVDANIADQTTPGCQPLNQALNVAAIIRSIPMLSQAAARDDEVGKMLQNPIILRCVLSYLFYLEIYGGKASDVADAMSDIKSQIVEYKLKCAMYDDDQHETKQAHGSDESVEPSPVHNSRQGAYNNLLEILLSDATLLEYYNKNGESINDAMTAVLGYRDEHQPFERLLLALPDDESYNSSSSSSNDGSDDITQEEKQYEEMLSSRLKRMKELGFMNYKQNIRALIKSGADVERAIEMLAVAEQHI